MPTFDIRPATAEDIDTVRELFKLHSGRAPGRAKLSVDLDSPTRCLLVAHDHNRVIGYGRAGLFTPPPNAASNVAPAGYYLTGLVIDPTRRRQGLGKQLTLDRMAWAAPLADKIWYFTAAANTGSLQLHAQIGFREITRDFTYPGVSFAGGTGVLSSAELPKRP